MFRYFSPTRVAVFLILAMVATGCPGGDNDVNYGTDWPVSSVLLDSKNSKIYIRGAFTSYTKYLAIGMARLNLDGTYDTTFDTSALPRTKVVSIALDQTSDKIYASILDTYNFGTVKKIVRLNFDGSVDPSFDTSSTLKGEARELMFDESSQKLYAVVAQKIVRFNLDGSLDPAFDARSPIFGSFWSFCEIQDEPLYRPRRIDISCRNRGISRSDFATNEFGILMLNPVKLFGRDEDARRSSILSNHNGLT